MAMCVCVHACVCISKVYPCLPYPHMQCGLESTPSHDTRHLSEVHGLLSLLKVMLRHTGGGRRKLQMMTGGSAGRSLGTGFVLGRRPSGSRAGDPRWPGWAVNADPGHGGRAVLPTVALLRTGQREEQSPRGWRHRGRCSPWAPRARTPEALSGGQAAPLLPGDGVEDSGMFLLILRHGSAPMSHPDL